MPLYLCPAAMSSTRSSQEAAEATPRKYKEKLRSSSNTSHRRTIPRARPALHCDENVIMCAVACDGNDVNIVVQTIFPHPLPIRTPKGSPLPNHPAPARQP